MSYFQSPNPWQEAAAYGRGLGDTLSEVILRLPAARAALQQQQLENQREAVVFPLRQQLLQGQVEASHARAQAEVAREQYLKEQTMKLLQTPKLDSTPLADVVTSLMTGGKPEAKNVHDAVMQATQDPKGLAWFGSMLDKWMTSEVAGNKPQPERVLSPGSQLIDPTGKVLMTNTNTPAGVESRMTPSINDLLGVLANSNSVPSAVYQGALRDIQQRFNPQGSQGSQPPMPGGGGTGTASDVGTPPPQQLSQAELIQQAQDAISKGADKKKVIQRLRDMGVNLPEGY